jgi:hypothetical protein
MHLYDCDGSGTVATAFCGNNDSFSAMCVTCISKEDAFEATCEECILLYFQHQAEGSIQNDR